MVWVTKKDYNQQAPVGNPAYSLQRYGNAFRFEVRSGDRTTFDVDKERSELLGDVIPYNTEWWLSYDFMIEPHDPYSDWNVLAQIHTNDDGLNPFLAFVYDGTTIGLSTMHNNGVVYTDSDTLRAPFTITKGKWYHNVLRVKENIAGGAILQWWRDGVLVLDLTTSFNLGHSSDIGANTPGPYFKFGIYRATVTPPLVVWYANMEQSFSSLSGRVTSPPILPNIR